MTKTNVARLLDKSGIVYEIKSYPVDEADLSAVHVAEQLGEDPGIIFKTLVLRGDKTGILVAIIPGNEEVNLKKAAKISGNKSAEMIHLKELLPLTGYIRGGCSPIGMKKKYPVYLHESCLLFEKIYVSAGQRGLQVKLNPSDLAGYLDAKICSLVG